MQRTNNVKSTFNCSPNYARRERFSPEMQVHHGVFRLQTIQESASSAIAFYIPQSLGRGPQSVWIVQNLKLIRAVYGKAGNRKQLRCNWQRGRQKINMIPTTSQPNSAVESYLIGPAGNSSVVI
jgi:hypothetical protein